MGVGTAWPVITRATASSNSSSRMSLFDRYQSVCQYHRPIDSLRYVWPNGKIGTRPDASNAESKLEPNSYRAEGVVER